MITFNGEKFIREQVDSILAQLTPDDELIVSDDSSTDRTMEIIKSHRDSRIKIFENGNFQSPVRNMEHALNQAKGDYVFLADQDDKWLPGRISKTVERLEKYDLVLCDAIVIDQEQNILQESFYGWNHSGAGFWKNLKKSSFLGCSMALNRKVLKTALPFPVNIPMHDLWIGLVAESIGKVLFMPERLIYYRRHQDNYMASVNRNEKNPSGFSLGYKIKYRLGMIFQVVKRYLSVIFSSKKFNLL